MKKEMNLFKALWDEEARMLATLVPTSPLEYCVSPACESSCSKALVGFLLYLLPKLPQNNPATLEVA